MTATLRNAPTPEQLAKAWTASFAAAVRDAAGNDGRLSLSEARSIAARSDALRLWGDNAIDYLEAKGQKSVDVEKLIASGYRYTYANAEKVAGKGGVISLLEARSLPADLRDDFAYLRGTKPADGPAAPPFAAADERIQAAMRAAEDSFDPISDGQHFYAGVMEGVSSIAQAKKALLAPVRDHHESLDFVEVTPDRGRDAIESFTGSLRDLMEHTFEGEPEMQADIAGIIGAVKAAFGGMEIAKAYEVTLESTGPQYGRSTTALVLEAKDGTFYNVVNESVG